MTNHSQLKPAKPRKKRDTLKTLVIGLWIGVTLGALLLFGLNWLGILDLSFAQPGKTFKPSIAPGKDDPAPDFSLQDIHDQTVSLSALQGKVVVVNFWATWCGPCVREMPMFQQAQDTYAEKLVVLGINSKEKTTLVRDFIQDLAVQYLILLDEPGKVTDLYQVLALPTTFFIDPQGVIRYQHTGVMSEAQFNVYLAQMGLSQ